MPLYDLRCPECGLEVERYAPITQGKSSTSCVCGCLMRRVYTPPAIAITWVAHFNHSVGRWCETRADFTRALAEGSEQASKVLGRDVNYVAMDTQEAKPRSEEGLAEQERAWATRGIHKTPS